ncbi:MAG: hypothetical protein ACE5EX_03240 [Phycisphaerae bacterium]
MTDQNRQRAELHRLELPAPAREHLSGPSPLGDLLDDYMRFTKIVVAAHRERPGLVDDREEVDDDDA